MQPEFTATLPGTYQFTLIVNDGQVDSQPDVVEIRVNAEVIGEIEEDTGDAEIIGEIEEDTGDAEIIGEIE